MDTRKRWTHPRCRVLPVDIRGRFARLEGETFLSLADGRVRVSRDAGKSWSSPRPVYDGPGPGRPTGSGHLQVTPDQTIVMVYPDLESIRKFADWEPARGPQYETSQIRQARLNVWSIRSLDGGQTWTDRQLVFEGYCGALVDMICTTDGSLVVPVQRLVPDPGRNATATYVSRDSGTSWVRSNIIDLGGHGRHDGAFEATLEELEDGRLWMLLRTPWDRFWSAFSEDGGMTWRTIVPSDIDSSNSPGYLARTASGRLALVWNRLYPEGRQEYQRKGGEAGGTTSQYLSSWHREELSIAFSEDDGASWGKPTVLAREKDSWLSYPYLFEPEPGRFWLFTSQGDVALAANEKDLVTS